MKAYLITHLDELRIKFDIVDIHDDYDGDPYGDHVPLSVGSNQRIETFDKDIYLYEQEEWAFHTCLKRSKKVAKDGMGTPYPFKGLVQPSGAPVVHYGHQVFNGGCTINRKWYKGWFRPLPLLHKNFHYVYRASWGTFIELIGKPSGLE